MYLSRLHIHHLRNLHEIILTPHPQFNIFVGENGSGKTSLLEAIHFLAMGRSFRTHLIQNVIAFHQPSLACFGEVTALDGSKTLLGIEKNRQGVLKCKIGGEPCEKLSLLAAALPLQLITPESFKLLIAGPQERRRFLDWGVFHQNVDFAQVCQRYQRLLKQRNAALKLSRHDKSLLAFEKEFILLGEKITANRQAYLANLLPYIQEALQGLLPEYSLSFAYEPGWQAPHGLEEALYEALPSDQRFGATSVGPHRAQLVIHYENFQAHQVLSRGQQKLLMAALYLAQTHHLYVTTGKKCIYVIDDLASELDHKNRHQVLTLLAAHGYQVFFTGVDKEGWQGVAAQFSAQLSEIAHGNIALFADASAFSR